MVVTPRRCPNRFHVEGTEDAGVREDQPKQELDYSLPAKVASHNPQAAAML